MCLCGVGQGGVQGCTCALSVPTSSVIAGELLGIRYAVCVCVCVCACVWRAVVVGSRTNVTRDKTVGQDVDRYNLGCCRFLVCLVSHCTSTHTRITRRRAIQDIFGCCLFVSGRAIIFFVSLLSLSLPPRLSRGPCGLLEVGARPGRVRPGQTCGRRGDAVWHSW